MTSILQYSCNVQGEDSNVACALHRWFDGGAVEIITWVNLRLLN